MRDVDGRYLPTRYDPFDPRWWAEPIGWEAITLSTDGSIFTMVDAELHGWLMDQGPWSLYERGGKRYARRTRRKREFGVGGHGATIYMHQVIARKVLGPPPSRLHFLVDHRNGNGLDNRTSIRRPRGRGEKSNLVWATPQQNRLNKYGMWWQQSDFLRDLEIGELDAVNRALERINGKAHDQDRKRKDQRKDEAKAVEGRDGGASGDDAGAAGGIR